MKKTFCLLFIALLLAMFPVLPLIAQAIDGAMLINHLMLTIFDDTFEEV